MNFEKKQSKLKEIASRIAKCTLCPLCRQATRSVPGEGSPKAQVMFIGEGPGYHEDQEGIPFCGASGKLLDRLLQLIDLKRETVWIGNVVKHRPPDNRDPAGEEIEACRPFLDEQIKTISPKVIVTLGRFSMRKFLPGEYISRIHGQARFVNFGGRKYVIIPMYHPAAALRSTRVMEAISQDFRKIPQFLGGEALESGQGSEAEGKAQEQQLSLID